MGNTREYTLVGAKATFADKVGCAVNIGTTLTKKTPNAVAPTAGEAIDGIITDITLTGATEVTLAVARIGDIVFAKLGTGGATVGDELEVATGGVLVEKSTGVAVAKALATGSKDELIPVLIK